MTTPRKRNLEPQSPATQEAQRQSRIRKLEKAIDTENRSLKRRMARLSEVCRVIDLQRKRIARHEAKLSELDPRP